MRNGFRFICCLLLALMATSYACAQKHAPGTSLFVSKAKEKIVLDGVLNETTWTDAQVATDFYLNYPVDTMAARFDSEARVAFDEHFLYVSFVCYEDSLPNIVQSLRRDIDWELNDNIGVYFDPFNDFTNGFYFTITPMGVQSEGVISNGGSDGDAFNDNWDNKWYSHVTRYRDKWIAELAIPFKSIRYNRTSWNMTFLRNNVKKNEISSWIATPIQYVPASLSYAGRVEWEEPLAHPGANISLIPYVAGGVLRDKENELPTEATSEIGFDAKIAISPSLNLDLTVNPDFSQVEVDRQVINLTRFEFGFPERRQFFLENSDLFAQPGFPDSRPFFSRRIGLARDTLGNVQQVPITYGARLSGKISKDWRLGVMNMQTGSDKSLGLPNQNYTVAVVQRQVFSRSNISFIFVNKQNLGLGSYDSTKFYNPSVLRTVQRGGEQVTELKKFNRVYGVDFNLFTKDNRWTGDMFVHQSADGNAAKDNYAYGAFVGYNTRRFEINFAQQGIGKNYNAETGFVPGLGVYPGYHQGFAGVDLKLYPENSPIAIMGPGAEANYTALPSGTITDRSFSLSYDINFLNTASISARASRIFQRLPSDFNPLDPVDDLTLAAGDEFAWSEYRISFSSDTRKVFNYSIEGGFGGFYNGKLQTVNGEVNYRYQPYGSFGVRYDYSHISMPGASRDADFLLVGPRLDLTLTDKIFFTTFVQYINRFENINLNARFQWRFKPASDFFLVYSENYIPTPFATKNRALVAKLTYWFNL